MKFLISFFLFISTVFVFCQNNVLVIDYNNAFSSDQSTTWNKSEVYNRLVATNTSVTRINAIPASISTAYDECWIFGNMGVTTTANLNPVVNYINSGGAVYVQSEVGCCPNQAAFVDALINAVAIAGPSITHNLIKSVKYQATIHPDVTCAPFPVRYGASSRLFVGTPSNNILFEANTVCNTSLTTGDVIGVRFGACDMISGKGAFIANGDFNIFPNGSCTATGILGTPNNPNIIDMIADLMDSLLVCKTTGCPILPITLLSFSGENFKNYNKLYWTTSSEINNDFFTIERSDDGLTFTELGIINGQGNSSINHDYEFIDNLPINGVSYYRIKQTDFNGDYSYSPMIAINNEWMTNILLYPSPTNNFISLDEKYLTDDKSSLKIFDAQGKLVLSNTINHYQIDVSNLKNGIYFLLLMNDKGSYKGTFIKTENY